MVNLDADQKNIIVTQLKPFLKRNDVVGLREALFDLREAISPENSNIFKITDISTWLYEKLGDIYFKDTSWVGWTEFGGSHITNMSLPKNILSIETRAFEQSSLSKIKLNEGLTHIRAYAFLTTPITNLVLPSTLKYIGEGAFWFTSLTNITFQGNDPCSIDAEEELFDGCSNLTIRIPKDKELRFYGEYDSLDNWIDKYNVKFI
jgi:hypothetical protein